MRTPTPIPTLALLSLLSIPCSLAQERPGALYDRFEHFQEQDVGGHRLLQNYFGVTPNDEIPGNSVGRGATGAGGGATGAGGAATGVMGVVSSTTASPTTAAPVAVENKKDSTSTTMETTAAFLTRFVNNAYGYCQFSTSDVSEIDRLVSTNVLYVNNFLNIDYYYNRTIKKESAKSSISDFVSLARQFIAPEVRYNYTDRAILSGMMQQNIFVNDTRIVTTDCAVAINKAATLSVTYFAAVMNIGTNPTIYPETNNKGKKDEHSVENLIQGNFNLYLLAPLESPFLTLAEKFVEFSFRVYDVFNVKSFLDNTWRQYVKSWSERALTGGPIAAKYAAVQVAGGGPLQSIFTNGVANKDPLTFAYSDAVRICNIKPPTVAPTPAPTYGKTEFNAEIPLLSVFEATSLNATIMDARWRAFRTKYPYRYVCLLQPCSTGSTTCDAAKLNIPSSFFSDIRTFYAKVTKDFGNVFSASNWFDKCNLYPFVAIKMPRSGVMLQDLSWVTASNDLFNRTLVANSMEYVPVAYDGSGDWISGFDLNFFVDIQSTTR